MSLRWRKNGKLVCGAKSKEIKGDTYIGDRLHYQLAVIEKVVIPNKNEKKTGLWKWKTKEKL